MKDKRNGFEIVILERLIALKKLWGAHPECLCQPRAWGGILDTAVRNQSCTVRLSIFFSSGVLTWELAWNLRANGITPLQASCVRNRCNLAFQSTCHIQIKVNPKRYSFLLQWEYFLYLTISHPTSFSFYINVSLCSQHAGYNIVY